MNAMQPLTLHDSHARLNAQFSQLNGMELVLNYGAARHEYAALTRTAAFLDLSFRGRVVLLGEDRHRFLHGQVTNDINRLSAGQGCYAALITAKGKMISDLNVYRLENELLLDFEPGLTGNVTRRLEQFIIADDVQVVDASPQYGLLSVQGPKAAEALQEAGLGAETPAAAFTVKALPNSAGEICLVNQPRSGSAGFDFFVPNAALEEMARRLQEAVIRVGGEHAGWEALETARIEAAIPRFGIDMDESTLPPEAGLEARAISYSKGCYIGQEIIARIRTYGQVTKRLRLLLLREPLPALPVRGDQLFKDGKEAGFITSAVESPALGARIALGYVRREIDQPGAELTLRTPTGESVACIMRENFA